MREFLGQFPGVLRITAVVAFLINCYLVAVGAPVTVELAVAVAAGSIGVLLGAFLWHFRGGRYKYWPFPW